jgi:hypothetical protein
MLLAILAASRYVETGKRRWWVLCAIACGAATGMVFSSLVIFVLLPMVLLLRPMETWRDRLRFAAAFVGIGLLVYAVSNPYVFINLVRNPAVLRSNLGTSTAMYHASAAGVWLNGGKLMLEGRDHRRRAVRRDRRAARHRVTDRSAPAQLLLAGLPGGAPPLAARGRGAARGRAVLPARGGKAGEYGRFALLPATVLCVLAVTSFWTFLPPARVAFLARC